ncbi:MAG: hypothetical protein JSS35_04420, partial [Proteobacteria bacterium]|nr:hypothetical protein [Pseudomonadota bacterium]
GFLDKDLDGKIEKSGLRGQVGKMLASKFDEIDTDHDGSIDRAELKVAMAKMQGFGPRRPRNAADDFNGGQAAATPTAGK